VGARLAKAGEDVTFLVRGANLEAIVARGVKLIEKDGSEHIERNVRATDDYAAAGPQDVVVLAVKANQVDAVAPHLSALFGPRPSS
jgi:2-dehydropantoate 2-reductase